ncbi:MAG: TetR/AcrR family transcriptional regulator [Henriciella sp.]
MGSRTNTPKRILEASRKLFNEKGYVATSLSEIAASIGISQGNLTYHFPSKSNLALAIVQELRTQMNDRRDAAQPGPVADDYVDHLLFAMSLVWDNRFLLRDRIHFADKIGSIESQSIADYEELHGLMMRIQAQGMFRANTVDDLSLLTRSIWVMSRYWMDHVSEFEGRKDITWADQVRGIEHHFALLLPCLRRSAQKEFRVALDRAIARQNASQPNKEMTSEATV